MIVQLTLTPLGTKNASLSKIIARAFRPILRSKLRYKVGPMGTTIEGEWSQIMNCINQCRKILLQNSSRAAISIMIDDRKGVKNPLTRKVQSLEKKLGRKLNQ